MKTKQSAKPSSASSKKTAKPASSRLPSARMASAKKSAPAASKKGSFVATVKNAIFGASAGKKTAPAKPAPAKAVHGKALPSKSFAKSLATKSLPAKPLPAKSLAAKPALAAKPVPTAKSGAKAQPGKIPAPAAGKAPVGAVSQPLKAAAAKALTKARGKGKGEGGRHLSLEDVCREVACEGLATTVGYCRMHYIKNWKKIKRKELILKEGKLNQYIEELVAKYPEKYIEAIRQDLADDKAFAKVIHDLDLDESVDDFEGEGENVENLIDNIKRDFDDEGDAF